MIEGAAANGWEIAPSVCGGWAAAVKGTEIHVEFTRPNVITRRGAREFLRPLLAREGFLTTRVPRDDAAGARFVTRLGFEPTWSDETYDFFMLTAEPFTRKEH